MLRTSWRPRCAPQAGSSGYLYSSELLFDHPFRNLGDVDLDLCVDLQDGALEVEGLSRTSELGKHRVEQLGHEPVAMDGMTFPGSHAVPHPSSQDVGRSVAEDLNERTTKRLQLSHVHRLPVRLEDER
jgi:hypothetical protein